MILPVSRSDSRVGIRGVRSYEIDTTAGIDRSLVAGVRNNPMPSVKRRRRKCGMRRLAKLRARRHVERQLALIQAISVPTQLESSLSVADNLTQIPSGESSSFPTVTSTEPQGNKGEDTADVEPVVPEPVDPVLENRAIIKKEWSRYADDLYRATGQRPDPLAPDHLHKFKGVSVSGADGYFRTWDVDPSRGTLGPKKKGPCDFCGRDGPAVCRACYNCRKYLCGFCAGCVPCSRKFA